MTYINHLRHLFHGGARSRIKKLSQVIALCGVFLFVGSSSARDFSVSGVGADYQDLVPNLGLGGFDAGNSSGFDFDYSRSYFDFNDPGIRGYLPVRARHYDFGDQFLSIPDYPVPSEMRGAVFYPRFGGSYPLVVILHGRHPSSYNPDDLDQLSFAWPPDPNFIRIDNHLGHTGLARHLASRGFVVATISANAIASVDAQFPLNSQLARARLIQEHLNYLLLSNNDPNIEPFFGQLVGKINEEKIGLLGHSRGAESVLLNTLINNGDGGQLPPAPDPTIFAGADSDPALFDIDAVMSVSPTADLQMGIHDTPMAVLVGYADGDTDLRGAAHYESSLYTRQYAGIPVPDLAPKHLIFAMGANHNYFNRFWIPGRFPAGTGDDTLFRPLDCHIDPSNRLNGRLSPGKQLRLLNAYAAAFFETYLKDDDSHIDVLTGESVDPFDSVRLNAQDVLVSYHGPNDSNRFDINPMDSVLNANVSPGFNTPISIENLAVSYIGGGSGFLLDPPNGGFNPPFVLSINLQSPQPLSFLEPHGRGFRFLGSGMWRMLSTGTGPGRVTHTANGADFTSFDAIQFRLALPFETVISSESVSNSICEARRQFRREERRSRFFRKYYNGPREFPADVPVSLSLTDTDGNTDTVQVNEFSAAATVPPGLPGNARLILNQVRLPLDAFQSVDLTRVDTITIEFAPNSDIALSDIALVNSGSVGGGY